jgi:hypothetical protein
LEGTEGTEETEGTEGTEGEDISEVRKEESVLFSYPKQAAQFFEKKESMLDRSIDIRKKTETVIFSDYAYGICLPTIFSAPLFLTRRDRYKVPSTLITHECNLALVWKEDIASAVEWISLRISPLLVVTFRPIATIETHPHFFTATTSHVSDTISSLCAECMHV